MRLFDYPARKAVEFIAGGLVGVLGAWIWFWAELGKNSLHWSIDSVAVAGHIGAALLFFSIVHFMGTYINGRWLWSPLLRALGAGGNALFLWQAVNAGFRDYPYSTAIPIYSILSLSLGWFSLDAIGQLIFNIKAHKASKLSDWGKY